MEARMETKINLRGMIHLDQIEDLISNLVDTVDRQQKEIEGLKLLCTSFLPNNVAEERFRSVKIGMEELTSQMNIVHASATARLEGKELAAGELATQNSLKIQGITEALSDLATRSELHKIAQTIIVQHQADNEAIREWAAPVEVTGKLQRSHQDISARVTGIEGLVACKLDRSELGHLEALAARLQQHEDFKTATKESLENIDEILTLLKDRQSRQTLQLTDQNDEINTVAGEVRKLASKSETRALARELENHSAMIGLCARVAVVDMIESRVVDVNLQLLEGREHTTLLQQITSHTTTELQTKASIQEVQSCVIRKHYDQAVNALGSAIDEKASSESMVTCEGRVQTLEKELITQNEKLDIVTRFVEWFTSRGENYEHNMKTIDKHLGNLANAGGSNLSDRSPYSGQIRFTSVMAKNRK